MKVDGGCLCGHITYEAVVYPDQVGICHCTDCQIHSGAPYSVFVGADQDRFKLLTGALETYEKTAESGNIRALAFCPQCGTRIYAAPVGDGPRFLGLRLGTIRQRDQLKPGVQLWSRSAQSWSTDLSDIPRFDAQPTIDELEALAKR
jgi:hypothetical protein